MPDAPSSLRSDTQKSKEEEEEEEVPTIFYPAGSCVTLSTPRPMVLVTPPPPG
jgi:hypothetical protein